MNIIKIIILFALVGLFYSQNCSHLCVNNCLNATCTSCYNNFLASASNSTSCACPISFYSHRLYVNSTSTLCLPCPAICLTCNNYFACTSCIDGFILNNDFTKCIPGNQNTNLNQWISKNVSLEIIYNNT